MRPAELGDGITPTEDRHSPEIAIAQVARLFRREPPAGPEGSKPRGAGGSRAGRSVFHCISTVSWVFSFDEALDVVGVLLGMDGDLRGAGISAPGDQPCRRLHASEHRREQVQQDVGVWVEASRGSCRGSRPSSPPPGQPSRQGRRARRAHEPVTLRIGSVARSPSVSRSPVRTAGCGANGSASHVCSSADPRARLHTVNGDTDTLLSRCNLGANTRLC